METHLMHYKKWRSVADYDMQYERMMDVRHSNHITFARNLIAFCQPRIFFYSHTQHTHTHTHARARAHARTHTHTHTSTLMHSHGTHFTTTSLRVVKDVEGEIIRLAHVLGIEIGTEPITA